MKYIKQFSCPRKRHTDTEWHNFIGEKNIPKVKWELREDS